MRLMKRDKKQQKRGRWQQSADTRKTQRDTWEQDLRERRDTEWVARRRGKNPRVDEGARMSLHGAVSINSNSSYLNVAAGLFREPLLRQLEPTKQAW